MWDDAACRGADPDIFFPAGIDGPQWRTMTRSTEQRRRIALDRAKQFCDRCPAAAACDRFAAHMDNTGGHGIWAGRWASERGATWLEPGRMRLATPAPLQKLVLHLAGNLQWNPKDIAVAVGVQERTVRRIVQREREMAR